MKAKEPPVGDDSKPQDGGALTRHLCQALGVAGPSEFVSAVYAPGFDRTKIAALAPAVVASAEEDPDVLSWILEPAGYDLGQTIRAVAVSLHWNEPTLPLAMAGGFLLSAEPVREAMLGYLKRFVSAKVVAQPVPEPVAGAVVLARRALTG